MNWLPWKRPNSRPKIKVCAFMSRTHTRELDSALSLDSVISASWQVRGSEHNKDAVDFVTCTRGNDLPIT